MSRVIKREWGTGKGLVSGKVIGEKTCQRVIANGFFFFP